MINLKELKESWNRMSPEEREEYERQARARINEAKQGITAPHSILEELLYSAAYNPLKDQGRELWKPIEDAMKTNAHHIRAEKILLEHLRSAADHPEMTPEVKELVDTIILLIEKKYRLFEYDYHAYFEPVIEQEKRNAIKESTSKAGKASKNRSGKEDAKNLYEEWVKNPSKFKNQADFQRALIQERPHGQHAKLPICKTLSVAKKWLDEFRIEHPCPDLEKILPPLRK